MASIRTIDGSYDTYEPEDSGGYNGGGPLTEMSSPGYDPGAGVYNGGFTGGFQNGGVSGYGRTMPSPGYQTSQPYKFSQSAFEDAFRSATAGKSGTLAEWQNSIFPSLQAMFPDIQGFGSKGDKIRLPNGQVIDAVISAGAGGRGYGLNYDNPLGGYFNDPLLQGYLDFGQSAIDKLLNQGTNPVLQQAIDALNKMINSGAPHLDTSFMDPFRQAVQTRAAQLQQPGYTPQQMDLMRTQFTDPLEAQRSAAKEQVMQRLAARGIQPGSGIMEQALEDVDRRFSQVRTTGERDFSEKQIALDEARKQEAVQIQQILAQMGLGASEADYQGQLQGFQRSLQAASQLAGIGSQLQSQPIEAIMNAMGIYGNMAQLPFQAQANAIASMNAVNNQRVPEYESMIPIIQTLLGLSNQGEDVYNTTQQTGNNFWNVLGSALPDILSSFGGLFGGKTPKAPPNGQY